MKPVRGTLPALATWAMALAGLAAICAPQGCAGSGNDAATAQEAGTERHERSQSGQGKREGPEPRVRKASGSPGPVDEAVPTDPEGRKPGRRSDAVQKALQLAADASKEGNWELALLYLANALTRSPGDAQVHGSIVRVAQQSADLGVVGRCIRLLASAANVAEPEHVEPILGRIAELERYTQELQAREEESAEAEPQELQQLLDTIDRELEGASAEPDRIQRWLERLSELLATVDLNGPSEEVLEAKASKMAERLAQLEGLASAHRSAGMLLRQLERHVRAGRPERAVVSRYAFLITSQLDTVLVSAAAPQPWRELAENRQQQLEQLLHEAERIWSSEKLAELRDALAPAMKEARQILARRTEHPQGPRGPLTKALDRLQDEVSRAQILIVPYITDRAITQEAAALLREAGELSRKLELERLDRYVAWATSVLRRAMERYANDRNWTNGDAENLATGFELDRINPAYLPPEAARALSWLLDTAVYQELSAARQAVYRIRFATASPVPLEAF